MKLLLIDGLNLVRRVYEANPAPDSNEKAAKAVLNSQGSVRRALREHTPTHALVVFDSASKNWRHALYERYREGRKPMPAPLREALPDFRDYLESVNLMHETPEGFEADDTLAAWAKHWCTQTDDAPCVVLSTDKDMLALLRHPGVAVRDHFTPEWRTAEWLHGRFGISPHQVEDFLALMGDATDGIPGVAKVGKTTAARLLATYGSLDAVLANAHAVPGKLGERLRDEADTARLSRRLTSLRNDASLVHWLLEDLRVDTEPAMA